VISDRKRSLLAVLPPFRSAEHDKQAFTVPRPRWIGCQHSMGFFSNQASYAPACLSNGLVFMVLSSETREDPC